MRLDVVTIFPEYLEPLNVSLVGKARARGQLNVHVHDLREWTYDRHNTVDDTPYGGGPGMVMKTDPWGDALDSVLADGYETGSHRPALIVPTPSGRPFTQELAVELSERPWLVFTPARYEGIDRRVIDEYATRMPVYEVSIGDYVLAGGEAAVLVVTEAVARLLPGVLGNAESHRDDSFAPGAMANLLEGPVYTKPRVAWPRHPRGAAQRPPRQDRAVAPGRGPEAYGRQPARPHRALRPQGLRQEGPRDALHPGLGPGPGRGVARPILAAARGRGRIGRCCASSGARPCRRGTRRPPRHGQHPLVTPSSRL